jgi:hypothetical protein
MGYLSFTIVAVNEARVVLTGGIRKFAFVRFLRIAKSKPGERAALGDCLENQARSLNP